MPRVKRELREERLQETERYLVSLGRVRAVQEALAKKYGVHPDSVKKWIRAVRERWAVLAAEEEAEAGMPLREIRRMQMREMLMELHAVAQTRTEIVRDANGDVVMVTSPDGSRMQPLIRPNPNYSASLQCIKQLRQLDSLDAPRVTHVHHTGKVGLDVDVNKTPEEERFYLRHGRWPTSDELTKQLPPGD